MTDDPTPSPSPQDWQNHFLQQLLELNMTLPKWPSQVSGELAEIRRNLEISQNAQLAAEAGWHRVIEMLDGHAAAMEKPIEKLQSIHESLLSQIQRPSSD